MDKLAAIQVHGITVLENLMEAGTNSLNATSPATKGFLYLPGQKTLLIFLSCRLFLRGFRLEQAVALLLGARVRGGRVSNLD